MIRLRRFALALPLLLAGCPPLDDGAGDEVDAGSSDDAGGGGTTHSNPLTQDQIDQLVAAHNEARSGTLDPQPDPPLPPVTWDGALADTAYDYASQCPAGASGSLVAHNANRTEDYAAHGGSGYVGENIYADTSDAFNAADALHYWMAEAADYDYETNSSTGGETGHYTQVVWRASVRIGCAWVNCPNVRYPNTMLCDYAPGGNFNDDKPY